MSVAACERAWQQRNYRAIAPRLHVVENVAAQAEALDRDPSPCWWCGEREGCRQRRAA